MVSILIFVIQRPQGSQPSLLLISTSAAVARVLWLKACVIRTRGDITLPYRMHAKGGHCVMHA